MLSPDELKVRLPGVMAFAPTPFRPADLEVDLAGFRRNMEFMADGGLHGVAVCGFVGEFSALDLDEYQSLVRTAAEALRGRSLLIAGVGFGTRLACQVARLAEQCGADCVMLLPPYLVDPTPEGLLAHVREVAAATRLGLMLHSMPGRAIQPEVIERAAEIPNVVAYKDELGDLRNFSEIADRVGDRLVYINGRAEMMMHFYFAAGATVNATAIGNFDPALALTAYQAAKAGDYAEMRRVLAPKAAPWYRIRERNRAYLISVSKESMTAAGLCGGTVRPPLSPMSAADREELARLLETLGYVH